MNQIQSSPSSGAIGMAPQLIKNYSNMIFQNFQLSPFSYKLKALTIRPHLVLAISGDKLLTWLPNIYQRNVLYEIIEKEKRQNACSQMINVFLQRKYARLVKSALVWKIFESSSYSLRDWKVSTFVKGRFTRLTDSYNFFFFLV